MNLFKRINKTAAVVTVLLAAAVVLFVTRAEFEFKAAAGDRPFPPDGSEADAARAATPARLPEESGFKLMAENELLRLKADEKTGHFMVEDKRNGNVYRSYPNPADWPRETISENWKRHLASPLMVQYVDFTKSILQAKETNLAEEGGAVKGLKPIPGGYSLVYELPATGFTVPIEVRIEQDYVETRIIRDGIQEKSMGLVWIRLFPFFGAEYSDGKDGYMLIPDGAGALIRFKNNQLNVNKLYDESVYDVDSTFTGLSNNRNPIIMPVFGMKADSRGFLAVLHDGEEYANIVASPSGVLSNYNWAAAQMNFRSSFLQFTSRNSPDEWGFVDYNRNELFGSDRVVRYYLLGGDQAGYVGMAGKYRQYLMEEKGLKPLNASNPHIPMNVHIIGGDQEPGVVRDRYIRLTTTEEAARMVDALRGRGVENMTITYSGWQRGGYSALGRTLPVDSRIGGDQGMRAFIDNARRHGFPVYLDTEYGMNNTGAGGFDPRFHAMLNLAGRNLTLGTLYSNERVPVVSDKFVEEIVRKDLASFKALGVAGLAVGRIGQGLFSDYNTSYGAHRDEARDVQERILKSIKEGLGSVHGSSSGFYALPHVDHIRSMVYDHSYDLFTDEAVPFAQIAAHGLVTYSSEFANNRQEDVNDFLRDIEYGAIPSFVFTEAETKEYVNAYGIRYYNTHFPDWEEFAAEQYKRYDEALGDVQNQFIANHRTLAPNVKETTYANGKRIIVNYNLTPYRDGELVVPAMDFVAIGGGSSR